MFIRLPSSVFLTLSIFLSAVCAYSQSADYSRPVGLMKIDVPQGTEKLCSTPFDAFNPSLNTLIPGQLTGGNAPAAADHFKTWDASLQAYKSAFLAGGTGDPNKDGKWFKDNINWELSNISVSTGMGFFIVNNHLLLQKVFLTGRIPLDNSKTLSLQPNLNLFAYPFSSKISLNGTDLKNDGAKGGLNQSDSPDVVSTESPESEHWLMNNSLDP